MFQDNKIIEKYNKPSGRDRSIGSLIEEVEEFKSYDVLEQINTMVPGWILHVVSGYAGGYEMFDKHWKHICMRWEVQPQKIVVVLYLPMPHEIHSMQILSNIINVLNKYGYNVRHRDHVVICETCNDKAIIREEIYNNMKQQNVKNIPDILEPYCENCS